MILIIINIGESPARKGRRNPQGGDKPAKSGLE